jgi:predicted unusual protein kinase regulating ubiquinone biosynthesis (AarF/ABC1/UbiB family)
MYDRIDSPEFTNETQIYSDIASSTTGNNIFPISPNYIYSEIIQTSVGKPTAIGESFFKLLRNFGLIESHKTYIAETLIKEGIVDEKTNYKQSIIIMEMIEGDTLYQTLRSFEVSKVSKVSVLSEELSFTFDIDFLRRFFTLYLLTLLAQKGYSHGDPHTGNIMLTRSSGSPFFLHSLGVLLTRYNMNVVPYIIDFGKGALLKSLQFKEFSKEILSKVKTIFPLYHHLYDSVDKLILQGILIISIINQYLLSDRYVEAILITTMCSSNEKDKSMFQQAFDDSSTIYNHLFTINKEEAQILNSLIKQAIDDRKLLETRIEQWQKRQFQIRQKQIEQQKEVVAKKAFGFSFPETHTKKRPLSGGHYRNKKSKIKNQKKINNTRKLKKLKTRKIRKTRKTRN